MIELELHGLELHGYHGVLPDEREHGQRFLFDVRLVVREPRDDALADAVAETLLERFPADRVRVRVRKPDVELDPPVAYAAASAERS